MKIIGHRGAAGLALENTIASIKAAKRAGVDAIEFDIRLTADKQFVLCHDPSLKRISTEKHQVKDVAFKHISEVLLHNGERMPTLEEALKAAGKTPVFIETKGSGWAKPLAQFLDNYEPIDASVISYNLTELKLFSKRCPAIPTYAVERFRLIEAILHAKQDGFTGVDFNYWLLNPLTYWLARRKKLEVVVYTVNHRWIAWLLRLLYPKISITTNYPPAMQFLRPPEKRSLTATKKP